MLNLKEYIDGIRPLLNVPADYKQKRELIDKMSKQIQKDIKIYKEFEM